MLFMIVMPDRRMSARNLFHRGVRNTILEPDDPQDDFARLFDQSPAFKLFLRGPDHQPAHANAAYLTLVNGYERLDRDQLDAAYTSGESVIMPPGSSERLTTADGQVRELNIDFIYQPIRQDGDIVGILVHGLESNEPVEAERADFLRRLSHGIRSPLNAVTGLSGLLLASDPLTPEQREYARALKLSADSVLTQVQDMLEDARRRAGLKAAEIAPRQLAVLPAEPMPPPSLPVLLVEDYEPNVLLATAYLESFGFHVELASDGRTAVEKATARPYALALVDVQMPGIDGLEATRCIRTHEAQTGAHRLPIVGVTAHSLAGDEERCLEAGMDAYLPKPFTATELYERIRILLDNPVTAGG